ncbi:hypothetical protein WMY93_030231 [Mugilogobius chulae]|uniref:Uncharacterized protein n=1 Tax=Mugilogobius chulae TaxID=88201 RepID=A0AAW0MM38_9GOBI
MRGLLCGLDVCQLRPHESGRPRGPGSGKKDKTGHPTVDGAPAETLVTRKDFEDFWGPARQRAPAAEGMEYVVFPAVPTALSLTGRQAVQTKLNQDHFLWLSGNMLG